MTSLFSKKCIYVFVTSQEFLTQCIVLILCLCENRKNMCPKFFGKLFDRPLTFFIYLTHTDVTLPTTRKSGLGLSVAIFSH